MMIITKEFDIAIHQQENKGHHALLLFTVNFTVKLFEIENSQTMFGI